MKKLLSMRLDAARYAAVCISAALLQACASGPPTREIRAQALAPLFPDSVIVDVKPASNSLTNRLLLGSVRAGLNTDDSDRIIQLLERQLSLPIVVTGEDSKLAAFSLLRALRAHDGAMQGAQAVLIGPTDQTEALQQAAKDAGVRLYLFETIEALQPPEVLQTIQIPQVQTD